MLTMNDLDDSTEAHDYFADLHAKCTYHRRRRLECDWAPSGYCFHCGRPRPTMRPESSDDE